MRIPMFVAAAIGVLALAPSSARAIAASSASVLLECLPYLAGGVIVAPFFGRFAREATAFAGCGCGSAPGALSLPAALATTALFGPTVAIARFFAALLAWRVSKRDDHEQAPSLLAELERLAPSALLCGVAVVTLPSLPLAHVAPVALVLIGAAAGAFASPCTLGGIALASTFHAHAPLLSYGMLCTIGFPISFSRLRVAWLPFFTALRSFIRACHYRLPRPRSSVFIIALLVAVVIGAPMPSAFASETTLDGIYPGEHLSFAGMYVNGALVRYAITCCRADAAPVSVFLRKPLRMRDGVWLEAKGVIVRDAARLTLSPESIATIAPPGDPFIYR